MIIFICKLCAYLVRMITIKFKKKNKNLKPLKLAFKQIKLEILALNLLIRNVIYLFCF